MPDNKEILGSSKITKANQITLPPEVRKVINKETGQIIGFFLVDGKVIIE